MRNMKAQTEVNSSSYNFPGGLASPLDSKGDRKETPAQGVGPLIHPFTGSGGRQWLLLSGHQALWACAPCLTRMWNSPNPVEELLTMPTDRSPRQRATDGMPSTPSCPKAARLKGGRPHSQPSSEQGREDNGRWSPWSLIPERPSAGDAAAVGIRLLQHSALTPLISP